MKHLLKAIVSLSIICCMGLTTFAQQKIDVRGVVTDASGEPIIGASVFVKGTQTGAITDNNGSYYIPSVSASAVLQISSIGFSTIEENVNGRSVINCVLEISQETLNEVVVVGYGTRSRRSITGAVDQVNSSVLQNRSTTTALQALQGASANLIIQNRSTNPNASGMNLNIRGVSTMGDNSPLIVIDGLISSTNTFNMLNPADIENVSILKDAGSAAIYGSRSANGVILVTTKKGSKGKPVIAVNAQVGLQQPKILFRPLEGWQNAIYYNQAFVNVGRAPKFTAEDIRDLYEHRDEEYWYYDKITETALQQDYNFSVTGGGENTSYMVSAGYFNQESNFVGNYGLERYNFRSNLTTEYGRFKLISQIAYNRSNNT